MWKRNNLDEMQEQKLLKIEHNGYWLCFVGLILAMVIEAIIWGMEWKVIAGEWSVFMISCLYILVACVRAGIWDRRLKSDIKTNLLVSLAAAVLSGLVMFAIGFARYHMPLDSLFAASISALFVFVLCFIALTVAARATKKRQEKLNREPEE